jgi:hypothetical protein
VIFRFDEGDHRSNFVDVCDLGDPMFDHEYGLMTFLRVVLLEAWRTSAPCCKMLNFLATYVM